MAERMKASYHKLKNENPEEFKKLLEKKNISCKETRKRKKETMTEEELRLTREKARLRAVAYRKRKKAAGEPLTSTIKKVSNSAFIF